VKDLGRMKVGPDSLQAEDRPAPLVSLAASTAAAIRRPKYPNDLERIACRGSISVRSEHTDLISRA